MFGAILPTPLAEAVYAILIEHAGASARDIDRLAFVVAAEGGISEFRFIGSLGFGGKFWVGSDGRFYVTCYREDETPERRAIIERTNARLAELRAKVDAGLTIPG